MRNRYFGIATFLLLAAPVLATATDRPRAHWSILPWAARAEILATIAGDTPDYSVQEGTELLAGNPWRRLAELTASSGQRGDEIGIAVAVCGSTVVVGASELNSSSIGAAYVFVKGANGWTNMTQKAKLTASDAAAGALFGSSVACSGSTIVVGAPHATVGSNAYQGEAYVFVKPAGGWMNMTETARLTSADAKGDDFFGYAVAENGNTIVVGTPQASGKVVAQGKAYIFVEPKSGWKTTSKFNAELTASNAQFDNGLGVSVSLSGNTLVAGAAGVNSVQGAAYVFVKPLAGWKTTSHFNAELTASDGLIDAAFGYSVSASGNTIAVGAYQFNEAYVFVEPKAGWKSATETARFIGQGSYFGYSLSLSGNELVVGAANGGTGNAAYVFDKPTSGWQTTSAFNAKLTGYDGYGFAFSVAAQGGTIVAGSIGNNNLEGAAYVFGN
jgi:hypothetical protein